MKLQRTVLVASLGLAACVSATPSPTRTSGAYADFLVGRVANLSDDHAVASDRFFAALSRAPGDEALLDGAVRSALASGDIQRARLAVARAPRERAPGYVHLFRAADALRASRLGVAAAEIDRVEGPASEEIIARLLSAWTRTAEGRVDEVLVDLAPLAAVRPYGGLFAYQQAMALDLAGREDEALRAYQAAARAGMWLPSGIERHADLLVRRGARDEAIQLLDTAQNRANPDLDAALARVRAGRAAAREALTPAIGASVGLYGLSVIFLQERDAGAALSLMSLALLLDPGYDSVRVAFAQQQADLGHLDLARTTLHQVGGASAYAEVARTQEAWIVFDAGAHAEALALLEQLPESTRARRARADMYRRLERFSEAEPLFTAIIADEPEDWRLHFARGVVRERLGRWPDAEADMRRALELSPDQPEVLNFLGYTWVDRGENLQEGLQLISRAVAMRPRSGAIVDSLGWAYYRLGDYEQALLYLERAVELDASDPTLNDHLGDVYWRLGRRTEARFQWRRALSLEPQDRAAIEAKIEHGLPEAPSERTATP